LNGYIFFSNAEAVVKRDVVDTIIEKDIGTEEKFEYESYYFFGCVAPGDNISTEVVGIAVQAKTEEPPNIHYVAKLWPGPKRDNYLTELTSMQFQKEIKFYTQIIPKIQDLCSRYVRRSFSSPALIHSVSTPGQEAIYLEDIECRSPPYFKIGGSPYILDAAHMNIVLTELAILHATSMIIMMGAHPYEQDAFVDENNILFNVPNARELIFDREFERMASLAEAKGFEEGTRFLRGMKAYTRKIARKLVERRRKFEVFCHGDLWPGNILFA